MQSIFYFLLDQYNTDLFTKTDFQVVSFDVELTGMAFPSVHSYLDGRTKLLISKRNLQKCTSRMKIK